MWTFSPAPDSISRVLEKFRKDIGNNTFNISTHANQRMVDRNITLAEIKDTVKNGQCGLGKKIDGVIGGCFYHKQLVVVVYAPYGNFDAIPNVVTVFREKDEDLDNISVVDLLTAPAPQQVVHRVVEKVVEKKVLTEELSDEELEELLKKRKAAKAEAEETAKKAKQDGLRARRQELLNQVADAQAEIDAIEKELGIPAPSAKQWLVQNKNAAGPRETINGQRVRPTNEEMDVMLKELNFSAGGRVNNFISTCDRHGWVRSTAKSHFKNYALNHGFNIGK